MSKPSKSPSVESFRELLDICNDDFYYRSQLATMLVKQEQLIKSFEQFDIGDIKASGVRSIVTISDRFVSRVLELQKKKRGSSRSVISAPVVAATRLMSHIIDTVDAIVNQPNQTAEFVSEFILAVSEKDLKSFKSLGAFWMSRPIQHAIEIDNYQKCLFLHGPHFQIISYDHRLNTATQFAHTLSARQLKNIRHSNWLISLQRLATYLENPHVSNSEFTTDVTSSYVVSNGSLTKNQDLEQSRRPLKFYTFCRGPPNGSVLFHCHGGAYMYSPYPSFVSYSRYWANNMPGVTIMTTEYRLSPEHKYAAALQDTLDAFLFITSEATKSDRLKTLGFETTRIILSGDSSGGNLALALLRALRVIGKPAPSKLVLIYPHTSFNILKPTPSSIQMIIDPFLTASMCMLSIDAYTPLDVITEGSTTNTELLDRIWYRSQTDVIHERLNEIQRLAIRDPLFCPLTGDFSMFANTELSMVTGEFDPLLDDSIMLVRKWPRKVNFQIASKLSHAFLAYREVSKETKQANNQILDMLKYMFGLLPSTNSTSNEVSPSDSPAGSPSSSPSDSPAGSPSDSPAGSPSSPALTPPQSSPSTSSSSTPSNSEVSPTVETTDPLNPPQTPESQ